MKRREFIRQIIASGVVIPLAPAIALLPEPVPDVLSVAMLKELKRRCIELDLKSWGTPVRLIWGGQRFLVVIHEVSKENL